MKKLIMMITLMTSLTSFAGINLGPGESVQIKSGKKTTITCSASNNIDSIQYITQGAIQQFRIASNCENIVPAGRMSYAHLPFYVVKVQKTIECGDQTFALAVGVRHIENANSEGYHETFLIDAEELVDFQ